MPDHPPIVIASAVSWGDVPTWVGAIAAVLGLVAAGLAAWYVRGQFKLMKIQADDNRDEIARQRVALAEAEAGRARAQAEQVDVRSGPYYATLQGIDPDTFPTLTVRNSSSRPIRNVRCQANPEAGDSPTTKLDLHIGHIVDVINAGPRFQIDPELRSPVKLVRRGRDVTFLLAEDPRRHSQTRYLVQFEDDAGLWWQLDSDMHLQQIQPDQRWTN